MKKMWQLWLMSVLAVFLLAACGTATDDKPKVDETPKEDVAEKDVVEAEFPLTLTDAVGNEITLEKAPETIVSLQPSNTEILFALGLSEEIIGVNDWDNYPAEALEKEKSAGWSLTLKKSLP